MFTFMFIVECIHTHTRTLLLHLLYMSLKHAYAHPSNHNLKLEFNNRVPTRNRARATASKEEMIRTK